MSIKRSKMVKINQKTQNQLTFGLISNIFNPIWPFLIEFDFFQSKSNLRLKWSLFSLILLQWVNFWLQISIENLIKIQFDYKIFSNRLSLHITLYHCIQWVYLCKTTNDLFCLTWEKKTHIVNVTCKFLSVICVYWAIVVEVQVRMEQ